MAQSFVPAATTKKSSPRSVRALAWGLGFGGFVLVLAEVLRIFVGANFHTVAPGKCYRSAQPSPAFLAVMQKKYGVRSIVNLRDDNTGEPWYDKEIAAADALDIKILNAGLWSTIQPDVPDFHRFVTAIKEAQEPVLIHCANGNDRSGLASAVYLLLRTDTPLSEARRQLNLRYGHIPWSRAACLQRLLGNYEAWLDGAEHSPDRFYAWAMTDYRPERPW